MRVGQEPVQDLQPVRIGFSFDPFLQGANEVRADMGAAEFLAPAVDLVEGFGVAHAPSFGLGTPLRLHLAIQLLAYGREQNKNIPAPRAPRVIAAPIFIKDAASFPRLTRPADLIIAPPMDLHTDRRV